MDSTDEAIKTNRRNDWVVILLSVVIGGMFLFSAWSKLNPIEYFEYTIYSQLPVPQKAAALLARFFIGLEAALGLLITVNILGHKKWILKSCILLLIIFSIHLIYLLLTVGNDVNCGCMGNILPMSPLLSLLKNIGLIVAALILNRIYKRTDSKTIQLIAIAVFVVFIALPFIIFPVQKRSQLPVSKLYTSSESQIPTVDLRTGKHILCFMSLSCPHCRDAARMFATMKESNPALPVYFALSAGDTATLEERLEDFMQDTKASSIPHHFMSPKDFTDMIILSGSNGVPVMLWMEDSTIVRKVNVMELNQKEIELWLDRK